jgi:hypothetical protein
MILSLIKRETGSLWVALLLVVFGIGPFILVLAVEAGWHGDLAEHRSTQFILQNGSYDPVPPAMLDAFYVPLAFLPILAGFLGLARQYCDRRTRESAFLIGEGATRNHVFATRVLAGLLLIAIVIGAIIAGYALILRGQLRAVHGAASILVPRFAILALFAMAVYCLGLWLGQTQRIFIAVSEIILLAGLVFLLILIKGFTLEAAAWLTLVAAAALAGAWATCRHRPL